MIVSDTTVTYRLPASLRGTILDRIVTARIPEVESAKTRLPAESIRSVLERAPGIRSLKRTLERRPGIIPEIKKASPSAGVLRADFDPLVAGSAFQKAGAAAISVVTEANFFRGCLETLAALRWNVSVPLLRKDFVVDPYQALEARHAGSDAVLLIAALFDRDGLGAMRRQVEDLGMDALVEVHSEEELDRALEAGAGMIGVNNRDLTSFEVSLEVCLRLAARLPGGIVAVAESGMRTADDVRRAADAGYRGFLIGEALMRASVPAAELADLISRLNLRGK
jgi:indole-3-glycerol phosphate synthase